KVTKKHGGSKLLCDPGHAVAVAQACVDAVSVPVTAKIRLGWDDTCLVMDSLPARLCDVGIQMITVHGRTTAMKFKPSVRLDGIAATVEGVKKRFPDVPVIGNGDITTAGDAERMIEFTGCDGVMVARGAMGQPWLFRDIAYRLATGRDAPPLPRIDRAQLVLDHFENLVNYRDEAVALRTIKTRISKYSAHLQPWPGLRRDIQPIADAEQFRDFWRRGMEKLVDEPAAVAT
ncbi:MAG: tRNA-dihydrouridine synthase, partial [Planctomycetota bacterium]